MRSKEDKQRPEIVIGAGTSCINFEFQKGKQKKHRTSQHRTSVSGKPTPSKWDDAQKWLVNLSNKHQSIETPRDSNADDLRLIAQVPKKEDYYSSDEENVNKSASQMVQFRVETKNVDCNESIWRIGNTCNNTSDVELRDMGTEMTPANSQEPSRSPTPIKARNIAATSPISSGSSSPDRGQIGVVQPIESGQIYTTSVENRGEICWGNGGETIATENSSKKEAKHDKKLNPLETRAMAWDEAERAKYSARYKREEVKIQAWENHEKRKAEMEMRRMEAKAERNKARAQEKYKNKIAAARRIAEEKRANAESKLNEKAVETSEKADYIRRTGHLPSSFSFKLPSFCW